VGGIQVRDSQREMATGSWLSGMLASSVTEDTEKEGLKYRHRYL
jgi:hypothetical protein